MIARRARAGDSETLAGAARRYQPGPARISIGMRAAALYVALSAVSVITRSLYLRPGFLNVDEAAHLLGSWEFARGGRLYVDFADNKPPLVYLFYATAQLLFGRGILSVRLLAAAVLLPLTALAAAAFFGYGRRGWAAALAFLVASATLLASDAHAVHCEHVMLLPLAWSLALLRSPAALRCPGRLFGAGALVGLATLAKQPAAATLAPVAIAVALSALRRRRAIEGGAAEPARPRPSIALCWSALGAGFGTPLVLAAGVLAWSGSLRGALFWVLEYNLAHIDNPMPLPDKVARLIEMGALVLPAAGPLAVAAALGGPSCGHRRALPLLLTAFMLPPALLGLRLFGHYFLPLLFALALAAAPYLAARRGVRCRPWVIALGALAFVVFSAVGRVVHDPARGIADVSRAAYQRIGEAVRRSPCAAAQRLFVWGYAPTIYAYAGQRPGARFVVPVDTLTGYLAGNDAAILGRIDTRHRIVAAHWDELMADLERSRPAHIVDTAPGDLNHWGRFALDRFPRLHDLVRRHYYLHSTIDGAAIYRRIDCDDPLAAAPASP